MAHVLIVDDEKSICFTLSEFLTRDGHRVATAGDAAEAWALLQGEPFDVVVTDIVLPGATGVELLERARQAGLAAEFVVMTGEPTVESAAEAVRFGAHDYLCKPVSKDMIQRCVANAARLRSLAAEKTRLEADNRRHQDHLEQLVEARTSELAGSNRQLHETLRELRVTQKQIIQQERLRALGEMASGIAHDFNNVLAVIQGFSGILLKDPQVQADPAKLRKYLEMVHTAAVDGAGIVARMREFYRHRDETHTFAPFNLNDLVAQAVQLTEPKWKDQAQARNAAIQVRTEPGSVPPIYGSEPELREVLINLILNAVDAIAGAGTIWLRTSRQNAHVVLEVADDGAGMDEETRRRCFEPFFTTKGEKGTGMGLAVVHGVLRRHDATVEVESAPGRGATFRCRFPLLDLRALRPPGGAGSAAAAAARPLRVLVADDDARLRLLVEEFLRADGHLVTSAAGGREALAAFAAAPFDLVITDRAMPDASGDVVAQAVRDQRPDVPVIMLTGFGRLMKERAETPPGVALILGKPVAPEDLRSAILRVMSPPTPAAGTPAGATP